LIASIQHREREQDRTELPDPEEDGGGLRRRRQNDGDAVAPLNAVSREHVRSLVCEILKLAPIKLAYRPVEALPDHRRLVTRVLVAHVGRDVVSRRDLPPVSRADVLVLARVRQSRPPAR
jgi:hypothetical protein